MTTPPTPTKKLYAVTVTHYIMGTSEDNAAQSFAMKMHSLPIEGFNGWSLDDVKPIP
jgi:hypothetical protein